MKRVLFTIILFVLAVMNFSAEMYIYPDDVYYEKGDESIVKVIIESPKVRDAKETGIIYAAEEDSVLYYDELTDSIASIRLSPENDIVFVFFDERFFKENFIPLREKLLFVYPKYYWL